MKCESSRIDVIDAGGGQVAGHVLFPDALGDPHAADVGAEAVLQPGGVGLHLADAIARGKHRQDRLVERAADDLDPAGRDEARRGDRGSRDGWRRAIPSSGPLVCRPIFRLG